MVTVQAKNGDKTVLVFKKNNWLEWTQLERFLKNRFFAAKKPFMNLEFQSIKELVSFRRIWLKTWSLILFLFSNRAVMVNAFATSSVSQVGL